MNPLSKVFLTTTLLLGLSACGGSSSPTPPSAPSTAASLSLSFTPAKNFHFTWTDVAGATYYKLKEAETIGSGYTSLDDNIAATGGANSFDHIVPLYDRLNSKYILQSCNDVGCVDSDEVFTSTRVADMTSAIGYLKASNTGAGDLFGISLAVSGDGNTLAVVSAFEDSSATGINGDESDNSATSSGAVYIYVRDGSNWAKEAYIKASNGESEDELGATNSLSLSFDGNTLSVGSVYEDSSATGIDGDETDNSANSSGAVYVFARSGSTWSQQAYLKASDAAMGWHFGRSTSLDNSGDTLAIGSNQTGSGPQGAGKVYIFGRVNDDWSQLSTITASNADISDRFGNSIVLSGAGDVLAVGANGEGSDGTSAANNSAGNAGAAYVFKKTGSNWSQVAYLKAQNPDDNDNFGRHIELSEDGLTLAVASIWEDSNSAGVNGDETNNLSEDSGAVYIFTDTSGTWTQQAFLKASNADDGDEFGFALSLTSDGNTLVVGAPEEKSNGIGMNGNQLDDTATTAGAVYLFNRAGGLWSQQAYIKASNTKAGVEAGFGAKAQLSSNGEVLAISAPGEDGGSAGFNGDQDSTSSTRSGAVYLF